VRHVPDGVLRRLDDEPLAVPDRVSEHLAGCRRCSARRAQIADDARHAARLFSAPHLVPDIDAAWARLRPGLDAGTRPATRRRVAGPDLGRWRRLPRRSLRSALAIGATGAVIAGTAAAATLTTVFAPTHVAPVTLSQGDLRAIAGLAGLGGGQAVGGFASPAGSTAVRFGTIRWSSTGPPHPVSSASAAAAQAGFPVPLPAHLPAGVSPARQFTVQPRVSATVTFNASAASLAGSSVSVDAGPVAMAQYSGTATGNVPTLVVATMRRPTAVSTGASLSQIEAFLLGQPGIPSGLAEEIRLLGDLRTVFPVPVPSGASVRSVRVSGWPGVLLGDSSNAAAGVIWEDGRGMLHLVAGILDRQDVLNVAQQLG
jgi:hypothetical protein